MRRFLMLVAVAVVAAAMYVAASPASHVSKGVSVAKFNALSKKVAKLTKTVKTDGNLLNDLAYAYLHCSLHYGIGVTQRGDLGGGFGYQYIPQGSSTPASTTALDLDPSGTPEFVITPFNSTDAARTVRTRTVIQAPGAVRGGPPLLPDDRPVGLRRRAEQVVPGARFRKSGGGALGEVGGPVGT